MQRMQATSHNRVSEILRFAQNDAPFSIVKEGIPSRLEHDAHGNNPPLSPLILRRDNEGESPYFEGGY